MVSVRNPTYKSLVRDQENYVKVFFVVIVGAIK